MQLMGLILPLNLHASSRGDGGEKHICSSWALFSDLLVPTMLLHKATLHISYSLNSLKGDYKGTTIGVIKGDTSSLDYSL